MSSKINPLIFQTLGALGVIGAIYLGGRKPVGDWWKRRIVKKVVTSPRVVGKLPLGGVEFERDASVLRDFFQGQNQMLFICGRPGTGKSVAAQQALGRSGSPGVYFHLRNPRGIQKGLGLEGKNMTNDECLSILMDVIDREGYEDFVWVIDAFTKNGKLSEENDEVIGLAYAQFEEDAGKVLFISSNPNEDERILRKSFSGLTARLQGPRDIPGLSQDSIAKGLKEGLPHLSDEIILQSWEDCGDCISDLYKCISALDGLNEVDMMEKYKKKLERIVSQRYQKIMDCVDRIDQKTCSDVCKRLVEKGDWVSVGGNEKDAVIALGRENIVHTKKRGFELFVSYEKKIDLKAMSRWFSGDHGKESDDL